MTLDQVRAIFLLAGYEMTTGWTIRNGYDGRPESPWWEVATTHGSFTIGWRKRVIEIDWTACGPQPPITRNMVTQSETMIHAWSYGDAVNYLSTLRAQHLDRLKSLPSPLPAGLEAEARKLFEADDADGRGITIKREVRALNLLSWSDLLATEQAIYLHRALGDREDAARC